MTEVKKKKLNYKNKDFVKIEVKDNGKGIEEKELSKVFERFYRIESSRSKKVSGHGLGLSIAQEIVESHKGLISVESVINEGSSFSVLLPKSH